ncbi:MAG: UDP-N-acetylmuramoyl-tripeptide--D-alanyl-D-alanine ligase [Treponema sp.]|nr:UDP-N-acetylmuramoyl-tripeptide--D-alanyl-D-alanine ligase [Treponema sp.]
MISDSLLLEFAELSPALHAELFSPNPGITGFSSVSIDSRKVQKGALFTAIPGSAVDGHSFVESAFRNGAAAAMVERDKLEAFNLEYTAKTLGKTLIIVNNTIRGLQDAARLYLKKFPGLLKIAITGSAGKTTTKEIAAAIIGLNKKVIVNPGNYNSETGLPLAVFGIRACHEVGIFEMGMNRTGEITELASVLIPDIALITNIGYAHIGIIGSIEGIAKEKKEIFSCFDKKSIALIPADSNFRDYLAEGVAGRVSYYGEKSFAEFEGTRSLGLEGTEIFWDGQTIRFPLPGKHSLANAFAAIAIAREFHVTNEMIKQGLESVQPLFGRGEIMYGRTTVIRDCYNSNPEALAGVLDFCESLEWPGRRVYVIGEMLELGKNSQTAHEDAGLLLAGSKADKVFLFGEETKAAVKKSENGRFFHTCDMDELSAVLDDYVQDGDLVLLKGSRGCALERLCTVLEGEAYVP